MSTVFSKMLRPGGIVVALAATLSLSACDRGGSGGSGGMVPETPVTPPPAPPTEEPETEDPETSEPESPPSGGGQTTVPPPTTTLPTTTTPATPPTTVAVGEAPLFNLQNWQSQANVWRSSRSWDSRNPLQDRLESILTSGNTWLFRSGTSGFETHYGPPVDSTTAQGDKYYGYAGNTENAGAILSIPLGHGYAWNETASTDYTTFGGWMQDTFFVAQINRSGVASEHGRPIGVTEDVAVFGNRTGSSPTAASLKTTLSRRAHWTGAMVGVDKSIASNSPRYGRGIVGRSSLILNEISNPSSPLTVRLFDMIDTVEGKSYSDIVWDDVAINNDGDFRVEDGSSKVVLWGTFYGADHREAGGVFDKNSIVGSFGATRDPALQDATD